MNKVTTGALTMVLAGSVTFSVINALENDQASKRAAQETALPISGEPKKADVINQVEKTAKDQSPTTNVNDVQTALSYNTSAIQTDIQQDKKAFTKITAINSANTDTSITTSPAAAAIIPASMQAPKTTTAKPAATGTNVPSETTTAKPAATGANTPSEITTTTPAPTGANSPKETTTTSPTPAGTGAINQTPTTTTTNHGQQVSQEKAAIRQDKKDNSGKKL